MTRLFVLLLTTALAGPVMTPALVSAQGVSPQSTDSASAENQPAILVADDVQITADDKLVASGNVEAMFEGRRLKARSITYDSTSESLSIEGPMSLQDGETTLILADQAELDRDMANGLLTGARIVMDTQVQLAANAMARIDGRYSQLYKVAVTSCRVCETGQPPLWQIRARRVVHDQDEQQLYFDDAQLRVLDVPILYLPRLRLPDPTLERATGFLIPSIQNSSLLGTGVKVPYFIRMGDHRDLTLTPFVTDKTRTLELRYRQAFVNGDLTINGAISDDDLRGSSTRGYLFAEGEFDLKNDFKLTFDIEYTSDDTYLLGYGYSWKDRLDSEIAIERARRDEYIRGAITAFDSLRPGESNTTLPTLAGNFDYERRLHPSRLGGEIRLGASMHGHRRTSNLRTDGADLDPWADGRDLARMTVSADWIRSWTLPAGVLARFQTGVAADAFRVVQGGGLSAARATEVTPSTSVRLRWPWIKATPGGATHVIEPVLQMSWVGGSNPNIPNDESTLIEFDEGNLFSMSRFTAPDRRERGLSGAYGVRWTRHDPKGWESTLAIGQVVRETPQTEYNGLDSFTDSSGLRDKFSDVMVAGQLKLFDGLTLTGRGLFDDGLSTTKAEARASWENDRTNLAATYIWLRKDPRENRVGDISEWSIDGSYRFSRHWTGSAQWRYDVASDNKVYAGLGMTYTNECVEIALKASRRFTTSTILTPSTDISVTVGLRGFTAKADGQSYVRKCKN